MPEDSRPDTGVRSEPATAEVGSDRPLAPRWQRVVSSRWLYKTIFLLYFIFAVVQLLRFEKWARGSGPYVPRPESVAGMLPIGHFTSFFAWVRGGGWDMLLPAGLVIILMSLAVSLAFKRGFCGWICPVGTVWELFAALGRRLFGRNVRIPRWLDLAGRGFRYLLASLFMFALMVVPLSEAVGFRQLPYMWTADLKIVHLMAQPSWLAVAGLAAVLSVLFGPVWCRYLCPLGGLYSSVGAASPCAVSRDAEICIHCGRCAQVCHAFVDPSKVSRVHAPECDGCMDCVKECPVDGCLEAKAFSRVRIAPWVWPLLVIGLWLIIFGFASATGNWTSHIPPEQYRQVIQAGILEQRTQGFLE
ncbi:MAG: (4Fe-4S)-binding protein [Actinobacteria bacterium HGW-Actinobacteria-7]|nr:MAG: (4Fe-4S)-binding protein [Actinobacteria bacterium HGW-Actinobacteria-7]